jgi:hypothetical protein
MFKSAHNCNISSHDSIPPSPDASPPAPSGSWLSLQLFFPFGAYLQNGIRFLTPAPLWRSLRTNERKRTRTSERNVREINPPIQIQAKNNVHVHTKKKKKKEPLHRTFPVFPRVLPQWGSNAPIHPTHSHISLPSGEGLLP